MTKQKKSSFKCRKCNKKFDNLSELQKHKNKKRSCKADLKCEWDEMFKSEIELAIHQQKHGKFEFDKLRAY